ncbi:protein artichoke-like [Sycon ciliatum]|uniref:protein artichoke-like n=1 Tax=Sycon ciliatum TaxID=27933 RepID=UPI0020AE56B2|eukprot:scpid22301/ scgid27997/ Insulin-like growth factor-binding protein complex acid labile subunit
MEQFMKLGTLSTVLLLIGMSPSFCASTCTKTGTELNCSNSSLTAFTFPTSPQHAADIIQELDLSNNRLDHFPPLPALPRILTINLSHNRMKDWPSGSDLPATLTSLDVSSNRLSSIPVFQGLGNLMALDLSRNPISSAVDEYPFSALSALVNLTITHTQISVVPQLSDLGALRTLDFSNNAITHVGLFDGLPDLSALDLSYNAIGSVAQSALATLSGLIQIDLSHNLLPKLHAGTFSGLRKLQTVSLSKNMMTTVPPNVFLALPNLQVLQLDQNPLKHLPNRSFERLDTLQSLNFSKGFGNILDIATEAFYNMPGLMTIDISNNMISTVGSRAFSNLSNLTKLDLSHNKISDLPSDTFFALPNLVILDLSDNKISHVRKFPNLPALAVLDLYQNRISSIESNALEFLPALAKVRLHNNALSYLPSNVLERLPKLQWLRLDHNPIGRFPGRSFSNLAILENLVFSVGFGNISMIESEAFYNLSGLVKIDLSKNRISTIQSQGFTGLPKLTTVNLSHNSIMHLPSNAFVLLPQLGTLDLSNNRFPRFRGFLELPALTVLNFSHGFGSVNTIETETFYNMSFLTKLDLSNNKLSRIQSRAFVGLESVTEIDLSNSTISALPADTFVMLPNLTTLHLQNNSLWRLPAGFFSGIPKLSRIWLLNNPFKLGSELCLFFNSGALIGEEILRRMVNAFYRQHNLTRELCVSDCRPMAPGVLTCNANQVCLGTVQDHVCVANNATGTPLTTFPQDVPTGAKAIMPGDSTRSAAEPSPASQSVTNSQSYRSGSNTASDPTSSTAQMSVPTVPNSANSSGLEIGTWVIIACCVGLAAAMLLVFLMAWRDKGYRKGFDGPAANISSLPLGQPGRESTGNPSLPSSTNSNKSKDQSNGPPSTQTVPTFFKVDYDELYPQTEPSVSSSDVGGSRQASVGSRSDVSNRHPAGLMQVHSSPMNSALFSWSRTGSTTSMGISKTALEELKSDGGDGFGSAISKTTLVSHAPGSLVYGLAPSSSCESLPVSVGQIYSVPSKNSDLESSGAAEDVTYSGTADDMPAELMNSNTTYYSSPEDLAKTRQSSGHQAQPDVEYTAYAAHGTTPADQAASAAESNPQYANPEKLFSGSGTQGGTSQCALPSLGTGCVSGGCAYSMPNKQPETAADPEADGSSNKLARPLSAG